MYFSATVENGNCLSHAVDLCDDSVTLMPLIQFIRALFSDGGDTAGRSAHGHDSDEDGSPAGLLGYLVITTVFVLAVEFNTG